MVIEEKLDAKIHKAEKKLKELSLNIQRLSEEYEQVIQDIGLLPEELADFAENPNNFSTSTWEELQTDKKKNEEKLNAMLSQIRDPNKLKKAYSENGTIQQHWLFVR